MKLYRIMIVDDEEEIRLGIIKKINWQQYGFEVVGDAENGEDALEKAEKLRPDIVMTDIKMPFMDGLELGTRLKKILPNTKIVIFSGSDDFEYAKRAIKINVVEYVLKPINSKELVEVLEKLKDLLDREYDEKRNVEKLYKHYTESLPILREQFLVALIEGKASQKQWIEESKNLNIKLSGKYVSVAIVHGDNISMLQENIDLVHISIKQLIDEELCNFIKFSSFTYSNKVIVIADLDEKDEILSFIQGLTEICRSYEKIFSGKISCGIGYICENIWQVQKSFKSAQNALDYRFVLGNGKAIYIDDVEPDTTIQLQLEEDEERSLLNAIKISTSEEIEYIFQNVFKNIKELLLPLNQYRIYLLEIAIAMLKLVQAYKLNIEEIFGENFNCYSCLDSFNSLDETKEWFVDKAIKVNDFIKKERVNSSKILIEKAKRYIKENYADEDLSVEKLCAELHVSPTYFSTIFKKETEMNFVNYLTSIRLEEAVNLLNTTDDKTYMIASKVGYSEPNYFSYVFKRKYGVAPSRYRKN